LVSASKTAYLTLDHGARAPGRPGVPIAIGVAGAPARPVVIGLSRGGVVTGRVVDPDGRPVPGLAVEVVQEQLTADGAVLVLATGASPADARTDDRGEYRIYGLSPGSYYVAVMPTSFVHTYMAHYLDDAELAWVSRQLRSPGATGESTRLPPAPAAAAPVSYAPVFFPGVVAIGDAERVPIEAGAERTGVDLRLSRITPSSISGLVTTPDGRPAAGAMVVVAPMAAHVPTEDRGMLRAGASVSFGGRVAVTATPEGRYSALSLPPGRYRVVARSAARGTAPPLWSSAEIDLSGSDATIDLALRPGRDVEGTVGTVAGEPLRPEELARLRVSLTAARPGPLAVSIESVPVSATGTFRAAGVFPGEYFVSVAGLPARVQLASVRSGGRDVFDRPLTIRDADVRDLSIELTTQTTGLGGRFIDADGRSVTDYFVVVFSIDREHWHAGSRHVAVIRPDVSGTFELRGLPAGAYRLAVLSDVLPDEWTQSDFLASLVAASIRVMVRDGERTTQDVRLAGSR
jgi:protocatechuate 3,4-dioxygenase beta subunit